MRRKELYTLVECGGGNGAVALASLALCLCVLLPGIIRRDSVDTFEDIGQIFDWAAYAVDDQFILGIAEDRFQLSQLASRVKGLATNIRRSVHVARDDYTKRPVDDGILKRIRDHRSAM